jgi:hypothetical protein
LVNYDFFDQYLVLDPLDPTKGFGESSNIGLADQATHPVRWFLNLRVGGERPPPGCSPDSFGVGYSYLDNSSVLRQILGPYSPVRDEGKAPEDLAFQATAHQRLGQAAEARAMLDRLRELMRQVVLAGGQGDQGRAFLAEADAAVVYDPIFLADTFSR